MTSIVLILVTYTTAPIHHSPFPSTGMGTAERLLALLEWPCPHQIWTGLGHTMIPPVFSLWTTAWENSIT